MLHDGKIYLVGGIQLGHLQGTVGWLDAYDIATDTWTVLADAPHIRDHFHAIVWKEQIYCIGGRNTSFRYPLRLRSFFSATVRDVDVYNLRTGRWTTLPKSARLPVGSAAGGVAHWNGGILYFGGETQKAALENTWLFDPEAQLWSALPGLNQGRHGTQAIDYGERVYVAAGSPRRGGGRISSVEVFG